MGQRGFKSIFSSFPLFKDRAAHRVVAFGSSGSPAVGVLGCRGGYGNRWRRIRGPHGGARQDPTVTGEGSRWRPAANGEEQR